MWPQLSEMRFFWHCLKICLSERASHIALTIDENHQQRLKICFSERASHNVLTIDENHQQGLKICLSERASHIALTDLQVFLGISIKIGPQPGYLLVAAWLRAIGGNGLPMRARPFAPGVAACSALGPVYSPSLDRSVAALANVPNRFAASALRASNCSKVERC